LKYQSLCGLEGYYELRFMRLDCQTSVTHIIVGTIIRYRTLFLCSSAKMLFTLFIVTPLLLLFLKVVIV
ncbi:hypothetical protein, partial [Butyrivibrio sp.]|uniref:hypothetical protein n=1 Tax=Butyrivibrio sp. TaxID=28121 RepID=UPI0025BA8521